VAGRHEDAVHGYRRSRRFDPGSAPVREFATAMSMSDMLDDFDKVVARSKSTR
jgi:hypothetical protein